MGTIRWSADTASHENDSPGTVIIGAPGSGKAIWNEEQIITPNGMKKIKNIKVGDRLYGKNGQITKVLGVYPQGKKSLYKVTLADGRSITVTKDHLFTVGRKSHGEFKFLVTPVSELLQKGIRDSGGSCKYFLQNNDCIQYKPKKYKVNPYIIGAFLGNGCKSVGALIFSSPTEEVPKKIAKLLSEDLGKPVYAERNSENNYSWEFYYENNIDMEQRRRVWAKDLDSTLVKLLTKTKSAERRIPKKYKYGSEEQRYALLNGLLDTDGCIHSETRGNVDYSSTSLELLKDIAEVVRSLGNYYVNIQKKVDIREGREQNSPGYVLYIGCDPVRKSRLFTVSNKLERAIKATAKETNRHYDILRIISIEKLHKKDHCTCFLVDAPDHQFIAGQTVVTHNTFFMVNIAATALGMGKRIIAIDPKDDFQRLYNINKNIHIIDINNIKPGALNPFEFLKDYDEEGNEKRLDTTTLMTIIESLCGTIDDKMLTAISPIVQDFINIRSREGYVDLQDVTDYFFRNENEYAQLIGTKLDTFASSSYGPLLFTRNKNVEPLQLRPDESIVITLDGLKLPGYDRPMNEYNTEEKLSATIIYIIAKKLFQILSRPVDKIPTLFFCDEAHILFNNPQMMEVISRYLSLGRSKNTAVILASQGISKFPANIAQYTSSKFMFKSARVESEAFLDMFADSDYGPNAIDKDTIMEEAENFIQGRCFFIDRKHRNGIIDIKSIYDPKLITSNPFEKKNIYKNDETEE